MYVIKISFQIIGDMRYNVFNVIIIYPLSEEPLVL